MNKTEPLIISNWQTGIGKSSVDGLFSDMQCVDIYSEPGLLKPGFIGNKESSTTVTGFPKWILSNTGSATDVYAYDDVNKLYKATSPTAADWAVQSGNTTTSGSGNGMAIWKGYVITARNTALDAFNIASPGWSNGWGGSLESNGYHHMIVGQDDILYIANGRYIASVKENAGQTFDPATSATFTFNNYALDLPAGYQVRCLEEFGTYLMAGTVLNATLSAKRTADIFPWDRISDSFEVPIKLNDNGVAQMINTGSELVAVCGGRHNIYRTNRVTTKRVMQVPQVIWNFDGGTISSTPLPGGIAKNENRIIIGSGDYVSGLSKYGIFSLSDANEFLFESQISAGNSSNISIGGICSVGINSYLVGWKNATASTYGIDLIGTDGRHSTAANTYARSKLYSVGTKKNPASYNGLEIQLSGALATGESVVVGYRTDISSAFTTLLTFSYATYGAVKSIDTDIGVIDIENIMVEIQVASNATSNASPKVIYVKLY